MTERWGTGRQIMCVQAAGNKRSRLLSNLLDRLKRVMARWNEMQQLDSGEMETIARELNLSRAELAALTLKPSGSLQSLSGRLSHAGLAEDDLAASHGDVLRDLQRVCSQCSSTARCTRDLNHERRANPAQHCPNEQTLRALADEVRRCTSRILPFPAGRN
ncbi:hypothetical protein [Bradyrhizobium genosp. P]|uniref:hypothetical protein n=1 Tax=Bradyrhizobium genosp. P TaxID=83641 RepID=UPI003CE89CD8